MPIPSQRIALPDKLQWLFAPPRGDLSYRAARGGRGSAKSYSFAQAAAAWGVAEPLRILCAREYQVSIKESFHAELRLAISAVPWLAAQYDVGVDYLRGRNGTEFLFRGLRHNISSLKSLARIDLTIVEEAEDVPEASWLALLPTIFRTEKAECWVIWNPEKEGSSVDKRFVQQPPSRSRLVNLTWRDNPRFPPLLEMQRQQDQRSMDPAIYAWVWEGDYRRESDAQVLHGKVRVDEFTAQTGWDGPYFGLDYGFSQDPTACVKVWVHDECLWVEAESGGVGVELDQTAALLLTAMPEIAKYVIRADSARPESTSYLRRHGLDRIVSVEKWPGSVEDGLQRLRGFREIIVHPRCRQTLRETRLYSYKVDRNTGDVLPEVVDANNHYIDAIRYALAPLIRNKNTAIIDYLAGLKAEHAEDKRRLGNTA